MPVNLCVTGSCYRYIFDHLTTQQTVFCVTVMEGHGPVEETLEPVEGELRVRDDDSDGGGCEGSVFSGKISGHTGGHF